MKAIYLITNTINGKRYIGSTGNYSHRLKQWKDWRNCCSNEAMKQDFENHGFDAFKFEVMEELPDTISRGEREAAEYAFIRALAPEYNVIGKPRPESTKEKLRLAGLGKKQSPEMVRKRAASLKKRLAEVGRDPRPYFKAVYVVETGEVFESVKQAEARFKTRGGVSRALKTPRFTVRGFHVRYLSVETNGDECTRVGQKMSYCSKCVATENG